MPSSSDALRSFSAHACSARTCAPRRAEEALSLMESRSTGLKNAEADARRASLGNNALPDPPKPHLLRRIFGQLTSPLILILIFVAAVAPLLGESKDAVIILFVLVFNTTIGVIQEGRAARALEMLHKTHVSTCTVRREGRLITVPTSNVTIGDIVILREGDQIPADGRFIEDVGLRVDESMLTGESTPVTKTSLPLTDLSPTAALGDIRNAGYGQTLVVAGNGVLLVTTIGKDTEVGGIAKVLAGKQTEPPLVSRIRHLSRLIALVVACVTVILFVFGIASGRPTLSLLATVLSLAVSVVPEGLPIVLTLVLTRGVLRMAKRNAVVKKLSAVEGLGQIQVICTDKTGTLTTNQLVVQRVAAGNTVYRVNGEGFGPKGHVYHGNHECHVGHEATLDSLAQAALFFGDGSLKRSEDGIWQPDGDPVNAAMRSFALRYQMPEEAWTRLEERPFSYTRKHRSGRWMKGDASIAYLAGSPESVLAQSELSGDARRDALSLLSQFTTDGLRVIAVAERDGGLPLDTDVPWRFVGFIGMGDALRPEVVSSIAWCREQGIRVVMITGDHPETALAIARKTGIANDMTQLLNGPDLEQLDENGLRDAIDRVRVFSRIAPTHKLRIIQAFRARGYLTAMTGDGVNDAPALHQADIGIAMGKGGTDVAREAAHLVLLDDNFATIVAAIQEGRVTVSNIRRVIMYLFSTSVAEVGVIALALLMQLPLPLLPAQIIWVNLVTDSFLDVSLAMEPQHGSTHRSNGALIDRRSVGRMALLGTTMTIGTFIIFLKVLPSGDSVYIHTMTLTSLAAFQWLNAWNARSETRSFARLSPFSNPPLIAATVTVVSLQLLAMYTQPLQNLLGMMPLNAADWALILAVVSSVVLVDELWKRAQHKPAASAPVLA